MEQAISSGFPALSTRDLEAQITELAGHLNAANRRWLALIAEFDRRKGWSQWATHSCAHWLNWTCGIDLGAAREKIRVAHALDKLPRIGAAMARGELSYSKVRAVTRVACPATEDYFLSIALHGTAHHVETLVRCYRRAREAEELSREARQHAHRRVMYCYDEDGSMILKASLPAEVGALLLRALDAAVDEMAPPDVSAETSAEPRLMAEPRPTLSVRRADALAIVAESFLEHGAEVLNGGERQQIVVHVDAATLSERTAGRCELEDGPALAAETARRLACDASVVRIIEDENGQPLDVGRRTRTIPPAIRRALNSRDRGCRFPGCTHSRYVDGHHIKHWAAGGSTRLANLVSLCRFHHRQVHEGGVSIQVLDDGALRFCRRNGEPLEPIALDDARRPAHWSELAATHCRQGIEIDKDTAVTGWRGERMDYGLAVEALLHRVAQARAAAAVTALVATTQAVADHASVTLT
jgi:Domain of unknown function (DUF222)/HNH endonuclease